jgi:hypothetical protein
MSTIAVSYRYAGKDANLVEGKRVMLEAPLEPHLCFDATRAAVASM